MFASFLKDFEEQLKKMSEEEALTLFESVKSHLVKLQKEKLAAIQREKPPVVEDIRYNPRKRQAPKHIGYFMANAMDENNNKSVVIWSKWSQGRPPKAFEGKSVKELEQCEIDARTFADLVERSLSNELFNGSPIIIVKSNMGYAADGSTLDEFREKIKSQWSNPEFAKLREEREQLRTPLSLRDKLAKKLRELEKQRGDEEFSPLTMEDILEDMDWDEGELDDD